MLFKRYLQCKKLQIYEIIYDLQRPVEREIDCMSVWQLGASVVRFLPLCTTVWIRATAAIEAGASQERQPATERGYARLWRHRRTTTRVCGTAVAAARVRGL